MTSPVSTVTSFCIYCDKERQVHAETGRCQSCGRQTARGNTLAHLQELPRASASGDSTPASASSKPGKLVLTETAQLRKWVQLTQEVAGTLKERAENSAHFAETFRSEAEQLQQAAAAFSRLLTQIGIEPPPPKSPSGTRTQRLNGRWSRAHEACVRCGNTDSKHKAHGLCSRCHATAGRAAVRENLA